MRKRKTLTILVALALIVAGSFGVMGCDTPGEEPLPEEEPQNGLEEPENGADEELEDLEDELEDELEGNDENDDEDTEMELELD